MLCRFVCDKFTCLNFIFKMGSMRHVLYCVELNRVMYCFALYNMYRIETRRCIDTVTLTAQHMLRFESCKHLQPRLGVCKPGLRRFNSCLISVWENNGPARLRPTRSTHMQPASTVGFHMSHLMDGPKQRRPFKERGMCSMGEIEFFETVCGERLLSRTWDSSYSQINYSRRKDEL